jgi:hypothetical protein
LALRVAPGATLDLNGHVVRLRGTASELGGIGLEDQSTLKHGQIEGTVLFDAIGNKHLSCGIGATGRGDGMTVKGVRIENCANGIGLEGTHNRLIRNQVLEYASFGEEDHIGISVQAERFEPVPPFTGNTVVRNHVFNSGPPPSPPGGWPYTTFVYEIGIVVTRGAGDVVKWNVTDGNSYGISIGSADGVILAHNLSTRSDDTAISLAGAGGRVVNNVAVDDRAFLPGDERCKCLEPDAGNYGIVGTNRLELVERNLVRGFELDGIRLDSPGVVVRRNRADYNGEWGINAVPGVVDGGKNRARGNGDPAQCLNVACR